MAQGAVAVNDTVETSLGQYITINVISNDYHPEGLDFHVQIVDNKAVSYTDSTITYFIDYENYYNLDFLDGSYVLMDENAVMSDESIGEIHIAFNNNNYYSFLDVNNIRAQIFAYNNQFWSGPTYSGAPAPDPVYEYPQGSGLNTMFNTALWVGGKDASGQLHLAGERYRQLGKDYWTGPLSKQGSNLSIDTATVLEWHKVWRLQLEDILYHRLHYTDANYIPIDNIAHWPAHGDPDLFQSEYLAPFVDMDEDGYYDPYAGDYPLIRGDQCIFFIFNDLRKHGESGGDHIGLEIHGMAYQFDQEESDPMHNTVFLSYKIFNKSDTQLNDAYVGLFSDFDLGYAWDDFVGCDVARGAYYGYNGEEIDGSGSEGYGENPPAQGIVILGGPHMNPNGEDDPDGGCDESITGVGFGDGVVDNERYGMTHFVYFNNGGTPSQADPQEAIEYYNYMQGIWLDGTIMEYGGNGHVSSGAYGPSCRFMFPGDTDPCHWGTGGEEPFGPINWTENTAGNEPGDRRGLSSMGPFTLEAGSMHKLDFALVTARGDDGPGSSVELLKVYIDSVKSSYYRNSDHFGYQWLGEEENQQMTSQELRVFPNPATNYLQVEIGKGSGEVYYSIMDVYGKQIKAEKKLHNGSLGIGLDGLERGIYILNIRDGRQNLSTKFIKN